MESTRKQPAAPQRRLYFERLLLAAGASSIAVLLVALIAAAGYIPVAIAVYYGVAVSGLVGFFYLMFVFGWNRHFSDPSLTVPQLVAAGLATSFVLYEGGAARAAVLAIYIIAFMFGMLTLNTRRLAGVAAFYLACYIGVVAFGHLFHPEEADLRREIFGLGTLIVIFGWFTGLGAYLGRLRGQLAKTASELSQALNAAESLARIDPLTGCVNRRHALELLQIETSRAARGHPLTVVFADIDHFKTINDRFGHPAGDEVLRNFTQAVRSCLRATDILARYGGEEFLVSFSDTALHDAEKVAERIRRAVEQMKVALLPLGVNVTVSMGLTEYVPPEPIDQTLARADEALYRAKEGGRNRIVLMRRGGMPTPSAQVAQAV